MSMLARVGGLGLSLGVRITSRVCQSKRAGVQEGWGPQKSTNRGLAVAECVCYNVVVLLMPAHYTLLGFLVVSCKCACME